MCVVVRAEGRGFRLLFGAVLAMEWNVLSLRKQRQQDVNIRSVFLLGGAKRTHPEDSLAIGGLHF